MQKFRDVLSRWECGTILFLTWLAAPLAARIADAPLARVSLSHSGSRIKAAAGAANAAAFWRG
jgi:hypothetical protein